MGAGDPYFHEVLYSTLVEVGATRLLLALDSPGGRLEPFLRRASHLPRAAAAAHVGPLQPEQVRPDPPLPPFACLVHSSSQPALLSSAIATSCPPPVALPVHCSTAFAHPGYRIPASAIAILLSRSLPGFHHQETIWVLGVPTFGSLSLAHSDRNSSGLHVSAQHDICRGNSGQGHATHM